MTSYGEQLLVRYEKLHQLAEQICQEGAAVALRVWISREGPELVELYRLPHEIVPIRDEPTGEAGPF